MIWDSKVVVTIVLVSLDEGILGLILLRGIILFRINTLGKLCVYIAFSVAYVIN